MRSDPHASDAATASAAPVELQARAQCGLALGWMRKGKLHRALAHLRRALELDAEFEDAHVMVATILQNEGRWNELIVICETGLRRFPNQALLHKRLIGALTELHGQDAALVRYGLERIDDRTIDVAPGDVLGCVVVRNEVERLPWFLAENRRLGISTFLAVDNGSTDGSRELLHDQPDVRLWQTKMSFNEGNFGSAWFEALLSRHGLGRWVAMLDADEILCFPGYEHTSVRELCLALDRAGKSAMSGVMLDMYAKGPIADTHYVKGTDFLTHCPYFDRRAHHDTVEEAGPFKNQIFRFGGARQRVFGGAVDYLVTKTPLVRYDADVVLAGGQHWTSHPSERIAQHGCAVLHFKYFSSFVDDAGDEAQREEHSESGKQYKAYAAVLERDSRLQLYDEAESVAFDRSSQLVDLGIIDEAWRDEPRQSVPVIAPRPSRPRTTEISWSSMITVYDRIHTFERTLVSVLDQAPPDMQIAIVADRHDDETATRLRTLVAATAGADQRVEFHQLPTRVGQPQIFNESITLARGDWVHIIHDDDWVRSGFYEALQDGIAKDPGVGAAFARHELSLGRSQVWQSWIERETAGVVDGWLDRIATECRVQFSAMAVRRAVYEELGGFRSGIGSAFDWEMWQRVAAHHRVWFDPRPLAVICRDGTSETDRLMSDGSQTADAIAAIEHARAYLPVDRVDLLTRRAREACALRGLDLATQQMRRGYHAAAQRNIAAALWASDTPRVVAAVRRALDENEHAEGERKK